MKKSQAERIKEFCRPLNTEGKTEVIAHITAVAIRHYRHAESPEEAAEILNTFLKLADIVKPYNDRFFIDEMAEIEKRPEYIRGKEPKREIITTVDEPDPDPDELKGLKRAQRRKAAPQTLTSKAFFRKNRQNAKF